MNEKMNMVNMPGKSGSQKDINEQQFRSEWQDKMKLVNKEFFGELDNYIQSYTYLSIGMADWVDCMSHSEMIQLAWRNKLGTISMNRQNEKYIKKWNKEMKSYSSGKIPMFM